MKIVFYDATDEQAGPELSDAWRMGAWLYRSLNRVDHCIGVTRWADAFDWLFLASDAGGLEEVQFWGHGVPGQVWLAGEPLDVNDLAKVRMRPSGLFWLRTCASFAGIPGQQLAKRMADMLRCRVAGHTHKIGLWHSGLHSLLPGADPTWSQTEGLVDGKAVFGGPRSPNTVSFVRTRFPETW